MVMMTWFWGVKGGREEVGLEWMWGWKWYWLSITICDSENITWCYWLFWWCYWCRRCYWLFWCLWWQFVVLMVYNGDVRMTERSQETRQTCNRFSLNLISLCFVRKHKMFLNQQLKYLIFFAPLYQLKFIQFLCFLLKS